MPIIQLPETRLLPDAARAPVDNERRPTIDNRAVSSAVASLAESQKQPDAPMSLADNGLQYIGAAISKAGGVLGALANEKKEAVTRKQIGDADAAIAAKKMEYESWKESTQADPMTWEERRAAEFASLRDSVLGDEKLTTEAKELIKTRFDRENGLWKAEDELRATKKTFADVRNMYAANIERYADEQDAERWAAEMKAGEKYLHPHEIEGYRQGFNKIGEQRMRQAEAEKERREFDVATAEAINEPREWLKANASPWKGREQLWARVKNVADAREREESASAIQGLVSKMRDGTIAVPGEIDAWEDPALTPEIREYAKEIFAKRNVEAEREDKQKNGIRNAVELRKRVAEYDPKNDADRKEYFSLVNEIGARVEQSMAGEITGELYRKYGTEPPKLKMRPEVEQQISKTLDTIFDSKKGAIPWMLETPLLDSKGKPVKDENGNPKMKAVEDLKKRQDAIEAQTRIEIKFNDWAKANPQDAADPSKARKKLIELVPEGHKAGVFDVLSKKLPQRTSAVLPRVFEQVELAPKLPVALRAHAQDYLDAAKAYGLNPRFLAAVSAFETGGGTSRAFREKNNAMGISDSSGPVAMPSVRDSIFKQAATLARANGPYAGADTIEQIAAIYAPPGASNDPNGTNGQWAQGVKSWLAKL